MIPFKNVAHKGRIAVYSDRHKLIDSKLYYTTDSMKRIVSDWMKMFPKGFYIHVRPYEDEPKVKNVYRIPILISDVKEKIVRPKAEYTNLKSDYYAK